MTQRKISLSDVQFGQPLPWDIHVDGGRLLLRKGHILVKSDQFKQLLDCGLYADIDATTTNDAAVVSPENPSVLRQINQANQQLEKILFAISSKVTAEADIWAIAQSLAHATERNPDIALAAILLNQIAGGYAVRHCTETAIVSLLVARAMTMAPDDVLRIIAAALTMNVGMLRHHEQLQGQRNALSHEEMAVIRSHPEEGANLLKQAGVNDSEWISYVLLHHENDDGSGYPMGKSHDDIPRNAKLISLADRYCARISARNYRKSIRPDVALREIFLTPDHGNDPVLCPFFINVLGSYPPGTFVRLNNGEIGVVARRADQSHPATVRTLLDENHAPSQEAIERNTDDALFAIREALHEDEMGIRVSMKQVWGIEAAL
ncbi:MAG: HD domain-containing phosphohydrolase [Pseudomonadota bacterium]